MKILHEASGEPTIIEVNRDESVIVFDKDGSVGVSLMASSDVEDDDDVEGNYTNAPKSAASMAIAFIALADPAIRHIIEQKLNNNDN